MSKTDEPHPRVLQSTKRSVEFSSPAPGRPEVFWVQGIIPDMVREYWSTTGELPYETRTPPAELSSLIPELPARPVRSYPITTVPKKLVIYERTHPEIRLVLLLGGSYEQEGESWQPILESRIERDGGVDPRQSRPLEEKLWDEICHVERRGRPRGTGHPKRPALRDFAIAPKDVGRLLRAGLDKKDLRILFELWENKTFKQIGRALRMSPQGVWKRWRGRIEPAIKRVNPKFSSGSFKLIHSDPE